MIKKENLTLAVFHERHTHPYLTAFSECIGLISLLICLFTAMFNLYYFFDIEKKVKTIFKEILIIITTFIPFFYMWGFIISILEKLT